MIRNEVSEVLAASPARVFEFLVDDGKLKQWLGGLLESTALAGTAFGVGTAHRQVLVIGGHREVVERVISAFEPEALLAFRIRAEHMDIAGRFELEPDGGGTRLTYVQETGGGSLAMRLMKPVLSGKIQRKIQGDLDSLKRLVERAD